MPYGLGSMLQSQGVPLTKHFAVYKSTWLLTEHFEVNKELDSLEYILLIYN